MRYQGSNLCLEHVFCPLRDLSGPVIFFSMLIFLVASTLWFLFKKMVLGAIPNAAWSLFLVQCSWQHLQGLNPGLPLFQGPTLGIISLVLNLTAFNTTYNIFYSFYFVLLFGTHLAVPRELYDTRNWTEVGHLQGRYFNSYFFSPKLWTLSQLFNSLVCINYKVLVCQVNNVIKQN